MKCKWLMQTCLYPHLHLLGANISNCTALTEWNFSHWLELIYTETQWVCLNHADPPWTPLNSGGSQSSPHGEHLFLTAHQGWSNPPVASAGWYMTCARGWVFRQKKGWISKWLFGRTDPGRQLQSGGGMCSVVQGKWAGGVPEQPGLQQELHSDIKHPCGQQSQEPGRSQPPAWTMLCGTLLLGFHAEIIEGRSAKAELFKRSLIFVLSRDGKPRASS